MSKAARASLEGAVVEYRTATDDDVEVLAAMNADLIVDEGHRNEMNVAQLADRMRGWLEGEYECTIFEDDRGVVGYVLSRHDADHVNVRQLFVRRDCRRGGEGGAAIAWLRSNRWRDVPRLRIEVLTGNDRGISFWRSLGFEDYALTMELEADVESTDVGGP